MKQVPRPRRRHHRVLLIGSALVLAAGGSVWTALAGINQADVLAHQERMNAAQELKYDALENLGAGDLALVGSAATQMLPLLDQETDYWLRSGLSDVVALSRENRQLAAQVARVAAGGDREATRSAWADLERSCSGCHDAAPQLRLRISAAGEPNRH